jgi:hypothetical protein
MPSDDRYGGLPYRDARGTVVFDNTSKLVCGFLPELYERLDHGVVLGQVLEVLHFPGSERCIGPFRGYVAYNYRDKMEASGWASMTDKKVTELTEEEKEEICDRVQQENRGLCRPRPSHVEDNPGRRTMSKLRVNVLWEKYVQSDTCRHRMYLNSLQEYLQTIQSPRTNRDSLVFRQIPVRMQI